MSKEKISKLLDRRVAPDGFFPPRKEIEKRLLSGEQLVFYYGIDPTGPDIHLGHIVPILLLKKLSDIGHKAIFLIGDFTATIGDPTGKDKAREVISKDKVGENMKTYFGQIQKILPEATFEIKYNSEWFEGMNMKELMNLARSATVQQMMIRDIFQERVKKEKPISLQELLYPLFQGYDSVAMKVDGEIGGHDQIFNMLVGRDLEKKYLKKDKIILATKLLVNESTGKKMSKSEGDIIAINDEPSEIRRKVLAIDDKTTKTIFELCTEEEQDWIEENCKKLNPREYKELLSDKLTEMFHGKNKVGEARERREQNEGDLLDVVMRTGSFSSKSMAKNLITGSGVKVNGMIQTDWKHSVKSGDEVDVGKGVFVRVK